MDKIIEKQLKNGWVKVFESFPLGAIESSDTPLKLFLKYSWREPKVCILILSPFTRFEDRYFILPKGSYLKFSRSN